MKLAKVMFSQVSVCPRGGGFLPLVWVWVWQTPPLADTSLPRADTPWPDTPRQAVNKRAVRIPLECILVSLFNATGCYVSKFTHNKKAFQSKANHPLA